VARARDEQALSRRKSLANVCAPLCGRTPRNDHINV
jgi:hypothetical protein